MKRLMILNGPNLNLLGVREPHIYGTTTLSQVRESCEQHAASSGSNWRFISRTTRASWSTGSSRRGRSADAIIINPAGYSFTSIAIIDAIKAFEGPVIEVHISNIHARDELHRHSKISSAATAVICGARALRLHRRHARARADEAEGVSCARFTACRTWSRRTAPSASRAASASIAAAPRPGRRVRPRRASPSAGRRACRAPARPCRPCRRRRSLRPASASVIRPTAMVVTPVACLIACANGT